MNCGRLLMRCGKRRWPRFELALMQMAQNLPPLYRSISHLDAGSYEL